MTPYTVARQAPLSMEFSRQEYWSELPFPTPVNLPNPEIENLHLPHWQAHSLPLSHMESILHLTLAKRLKSDTLDLGHFLKYFCVSLQIPQRRVGQRNSCDLGLLATGGQGFGLERYDTAWCVFKRKGSKGRVSSSEDSQSS